MARGLLVHRQDRFPTVTMMAVDLNTYIGIHAAALKVRSQRTELLANNLANADTPNFKARDIDFREALAAAGKNNSPVRMATTNGAHIAIGNVAAGDPPELKYRTPLAPSLDGNTVDTQLEQAAFAENAVRYQASLTFLSAKFRSLMTAITGQ
ncbi:MAG TPA: flagellar basal body rod protein FlgB [Steroidobacteraceae bacterium]|nr:flagellar basal body rod protein FlgB [Steroidobacteraceae bacterium]